MIQKQQMKVWMAAIGLSIMMLAFTGCGSGGGGVVNTITALLAQPANLTATSGDSQVSLSWTAVSGATSYNVYYGTTAGVTTTTGTKLANTATPQVITGLTNGTVYYFAVTSVNSAGESVITNVVSATPTAASSVKPAGIVASGGDGQITVSWSAVTGAASYNIYYGTSAGVTVTTGIKLANVTSPRVVTGLTNGTAYYFVVTAVTAGVESGVSSEKSAIPAATPQAPGSPTGRTVTSTVAGQMAVTWTQVVGATSYNVYYLQAGSQPTNAAVLATTPVSSAATSLNVSSLTSGATYYILVTAVNAAGESGTQTKAQAVTIL
ncbi:MAG: fibronectin type III domain-containing protein [Desulfuromonadales bacterium]